jgi:hypothetical protein
MLAAAVSLLAVTPKARSDTEYALTAFTPWGDTQEPPELAGAFRSRIHGAGDKIIVYVEKQHALREHHTSAQSDKWAQDLVNSMLPTIAASTRNHSAAQVHAMHDLSATYPGRELMAPIDLAVEPSAAQPWHRLLIYVDSIQGIANSFDFWTRPDPFVQATITSNAVHNLDNSWRTLVTPSNVLDYAFNEKGMLLFRPGLANVEISAWDADTVTSNDLIVRQILPIPSFGASSPSPWVKLVRGARIRNRRLLLLMDHHSLGLPHCC